MKITALYERLSADDSNLGDSVSIKHQKQMLEDYAIAHGYEPYRHFTDDGWSGTNFHRPAFREMIDLVEKGEVERIIVKDLSRFGRDYLRTGFYVDVLFPELDIHFIAIHSHVDSRSGLNQDYIPFINILNDITNREKARKRRATYEHQWSQGKVPYHAPVYGYLNHPDDPSRYTPDPDAAPIVREIFEMRDRGMLPKEIAAELTRRKVPTPGWHYQHNIIARKLPSISEENKYTWNSNAVYFIFTKEEYIGVRLLDRRKKL